MNCDPQTHQQPAFPHDDNFACLVIQLWGVHSSNFDGSSPQYQDSNYHSCRRPCLKSMNGMSKIQCISLMSLLEWTGQWSLEEGLTIATQKQIAHEEEQKPSQVASTYAVVDLHRDKQCSQ